MVLGSFGEMDCDGNVQLKGMRVMYVGILIASLPTYY